MFQIIGHGGQREENLNTSNLARSELIQRSEKIYAKRFKSELERTHPNSFVAIEPDSEDYFLGTTLTEAAFAVRAAHPGKRAYILRVGHSATVHMGTVDI